MVLLFNILFLRPLLGKGHEPTQKQDLTPMKLLYSLLACVFVAGCQLIDPKEELPSFIDINTYGFAIAPNQGTSSHDISEHWFSFNDNLIGAYDLPANVPSLEAGSTKVRIQAGIKNNGIGSTRIRYPFYQPYDTVMNLAPGQTYEVTPVFRYYSNLEIDALRNFESGNFLVSNGNNEGVAESTTNQDIVFEGNRSGAILLDGDADYFLFKDVNSLDLEAGNTIFLEMNYSCNNSFILGSYVTTGGIARKTPLITITPTTSAATLPSWNKIYIDLGALALGNPNASGHEIYFEGIQSEANAPRIYLDNLKIVRWQ
jgi:hypothetical protein